MLALDEGRDGPVAADALPIRCVEGPKDRRLTGAGGEAIPLSPLDVVP